jgi:hypothetical protein
VFFVDFGDREARLEVKVDLVGAHVGDRFNWCVHNGITLEQEGLGQWCVGIEKFARLSAAFFFGVAIREGSKGLRIQRVKSTPG